MKTALITGCNRGLGKALLKAFSDSGFKIIALIRSTSEEFEDYCNQFPTEVSFINADLSDKHSLQQAVEEISNVDVDIDVLINNAAVNNNKPIFYIDYEDVDVSFRVNYFAPLLISKAVAQKMIDRDIKGNIINITSVAANSTEPGGCIYDATKSALNTMTRSLSQELAPFDIRVNGIACSVLNTDMFNGFNDKLKKKVLKRIAMKRPASLDEVADCALFLASDKASYITGDILNVDGGYAY